MSPPASPSPNLPPGYELETILAERPGIQVLRARSEGRSLVLRLQAAAGAGAEEGRAELAVLAAASHPGIAELVDHGTLPGGGSYLARRWVEGTDLFAWSEGRTPEEIGRTVARLCPALEHLHRQGFVHADLKPENVIVDPAGEPVLCDFGLARPHAALEPGDREQEAGRGAGVSGSLFALSPEELLGLELTPRADLFALGAMLHRLLCATRRSAREFYAHFPRSSFLDATGTEPEELPVWSRDLVVALTARDPGRRPRSAGDVGRQLAQRLKIPYPEDAAEALLGWPVATGRDAWSAALLRRLEVDPAANRWLELPPEEDPRPLWEHLRLYASLRGRTSRRVDLAQEASGWTDGVALDEWAASVASAEDDWIALLSGPHDPQSQRALRSLARACSLVRQRGEGRRPHLVVLSSAGAPEGDWLSEPVPPVDAAAVVRFVDAQLLAESAERRQAFATNLVEASGGSATRLDRLLVEACHAGALLREEAGFRLRPGALPDLRTLRARQSVETLRDEGLARLLAALVVCGGRAGADELTRLLEIEPREFAPLLLAARRGGWIDEERTAAALRLHLRPDRGAPLRRPDQWKRLHAHRAEDLSARDESAGLAHAFLSDPAPSRTAELATVLAHARESGRAEVALDLLEVVSEAAPRCGIELPAEAPALSLEGARSWCALGQTELALRAVEHLETESDPDLAARRELVLAQVAVLRHETAAALAHLDLAVERDRACEPEATAMRIELLHSLGQDAEVREAVREFDPAGREEAGELTFRRRAYLLSLDAMSALRLGELNEARRSLAHLVAEVVERGGDPGLEAALRIDLAILERGSGSLERAREELERCLELYRRAGLVAGLAHAKATLGGLLRELGRLDEAEPLLRATVETRVRLGDEEGAATARGMLGLLSFERGHARAGIESLRRTAEAMTGAQRRRHAPVLLAKAREMGARIGISSEASATPSEADEADPRILISRARALWLDDSPEEAVDLARRGAALAASLRLERMTVEAERLACRISGDSPPADEDRLGEAGPLEELDERLRHALRPDRFRIDEMLELAEELERHGRDDRAARAWLALAARDDDPERAREHIGRAESVLEPCLAGLGAKETDAFRRSLLGEPDPWPGDLVPRIDAESSDEEFEMEVLSLFEINRRLAQQRDLDTLLGVIVENALDVTGAERGFLVLEEHGDLRFDTALDSCRGDVAQPEFEVSGSVVREALERMEPLRISNAVDDPLLGHQTSVVSLELRSILCVPFAISDELRGAIYVDHRLRKGAFDDRAERLCSLLSDQAALAIQQIKRLDEIRDLNRQLERRVVQRESDLHEARRALRAAGGALPDAGLVGDSPPMEAARDLLRKAAPSDLPVLVLGESGTGKELAARSLHDLSPRSTAPFVSESCAALPASLIESELFGYRRGAFTGADRDRPGLIEQAEGGTLFLDEIGELPGDLQAKLLRVLETSEVRRLGDEAPRAVDFRLVVATNRDLEEEIREKRFREDLFYRLDGIRITMPGLADRPEDIEPLVRHFLARQEAEGQPPRRISRRVLAALARRRWPGNVRELRNEVARLCVLSEGELDDPSLVSTPASLGAQGSGSNRGVQPLADVERQAILNALEQTGGDKREAARLLGISRAKIYQRIKDWKENGEGVD